MSQDMRNCDDTAECNVFPEKKKLSRYYALWRYRHKRNYLAYKKPVCWISICKTSHCALISSPLSPFQKECETIRAENKRTQRCLQVELAEGSLVEVTPLCITNVCHKRKTRHTECYKKVLYTGPKWTRNIFTNLSPNPARTWPDEQLCSTRRRHCNSVTSSVVAWLHTKTKRVKHVESKT